MGALIWIIIVYGWHGHYRETRSAIFGYVTIVNALRKLWCIVVDIFEINLYIGIADKTFATLILGEDGKTPLGPTVRLIAIKRLKERKIKLISYIKEYQYSRKILCGLSYQIFSLLWITNGKVFEDFIFDIILIKSRVLWKDFRTLFWIPSQILNSFLKEWTSIWRFSIRQNFHENLRCSVLNSFLKEWASIWKFHIGQNLYENLGCYGKVLFLFSIFRTLFWISSEILNSFHKEWTNNWWFHIRQNLHENFGCFGNLSNSIFNFQNPLLNSLSNFEFLF